MCNSCANTVTDLQSFTFHPRMKDMFVLRRYWAKFNGTYMRFSKGWFSSLNHSIFLLLNINYQHKSDLWCPGLCLGCFVQILTTNMQLRQWYLVDRIKSAWQAIFFANLVLIWSKSLTTFYCDRYRRSWIYWILLKLRDSIGVGRKCN